MEINNINKTKEVKFNKKVLVNMDADLINDVKHYVKLNKHVYNSVSHFVRSALIMKLRKERGR